MTKKKKKTSCKKKVTAEAINLARAYTGEKEMCSVTLFAQGGGSEKGKKWRKWEDAVLTPLIFALAADIKIRCRVNLAN